MFAKKTIKDIDIDNKKVLLRVDYNVPSDKSGQIEDDYRIKQSLPTLHFLIEHGCKIVIISHRGRPSQSNDYDPTSSLKPVSERLSELLQKQVTFINACIGDEVWEKTKEMKSGDIVVLENLRYDEREENNSDEFASAVIGSCGAEVFVQDGFGVVHRAHASTDAMARNTIPAVAGLLLENEVTKIDSAMQDADRPLMVVVGGAKISDKIEILNRFIEIADFVAVVGALANTFLLAEGYEVGTSLAEPNDVPIAKEILEKAHQKACQTNFTFYVPRDVVVAKDMNAEATTRIVDLSHNTWADIESYPKMPSGVSYTVQKDEKILDIGPFSASYIAGAAKMAKTVIWNGTCGVTEIKGLSGAHDPFAHGTKVLVEGLTSTHGEKNHPYVVVGGGDTVAYVESQDGLRERLGHVSTGGGASLELMAGKELPGVVVLLDKD